MADDSPEEFGPYLVYEQLGMGGVATVHRAEVRGVAGFRKPVALKRLLPHLMMTPDIVQAFVREARLASHMQHENIAQTYELGKVGKTYFISMEYVPGPTLDQMMRHSQAVAGAIPTPVALGLIVQLCDALDYAHNLRDDTGTPLGIIHRDVSPPNIIVSNTGIVKLLDFGIAKVQHTMGDTNTTGQNIIKGRFNYIAPEYLEGLLDLRADLFAIGVIGHELLTGRRLFDGETDFDTSVQVLNMPIQPPSRWATSVPAELDAIILTALQRDPSKRWQSASALRNALVNLRDSVGVATHAEILEWVHWAFSQKTRPANKKLERVIDMLNEPTSTEAQLTPDQQRQLEGFQEPIATLPGVGLFPIPSEQELMKSTERQKLLRQLEQGGNISMGRPSRPLIIEAKPLPVRTRQLAGSIVPHDTDTGPIAALPKPKPPVHPEAPERRGLRILVYLLVILVAAGGGVMAATQLLDVELPF